jgi:tetratricopeptide (TPR) repeat protein
VVTGGAAFDLATRKLREALDAERAGDLIGAVNALCVAVNCAPEREELARELARVRANLAASLADTYAQQAVLEEQMGKWAAAALSWARVCEGRPNDAAPHRRTAEALVRAQGDLHRARDYALRAVEIDPSDHRAHLALARVYIAAGLRRNARRELETAARLDPTDETVKNLLRDLT